MATHTRIRTDQDAREAARAFRALARSTSVMITRGEHGLWLAEGAPAAAGQPLHETPLVVETNLAAKAREVSDVTGAGDTVIATLAVALASGATLDPGRRARQPCRRRRRRQVRARRGHVRRAARRARLRLHTR